MSESGEEFIEMREREQADRERHAEEKLSDFFATNWNAHPQGTDLQERVYELKILGLE